MENSDFLPLYGPDVFSGYLFLKGHFKALLDTWHADFYSHF